MLSKKDKYSEFLETIGDKYNMETEDRTQLLMHLTNINSTMTDSLTLFNILISQLKVKLGKKKFNKFYDEYLNSEEVISILGPSVSEIYFHKFDKDEMKNRLIKGAVLKSILESGEGYKNFVCWCYLKTCIDAIINEQTEYEPTLCGLIQLLDELNELAKKDKESEEEDAFGEFYKSLCVGSDTGKIFEYIKADKKTKAVCALNVLNKAKEYSNTGAEMSKIVIQQGA